MKSPNMRCQDSEILHKIKENTSYTSMLKIPTIFHSILNMLLKDFYLTFIFYIIVTAIW